MDAINTTSLTDAERIDRLRLIRSDNVGPRGIMAQTPPRGPSGANWLRFHLRPKSSRCLSQQIRFGHCERDGTCLFFFVERHLGN